MSRSVWSAPHSGAVPSRRPGTPRTVEIKAPECGALQTLRAVRLRLCCLEERQQTFAINHLLAIRFDRRKVHERGIQIERDHRLLANLARLDLSGPAYDARHPQSTLIKIRLAAAQRRIVRHSPLASVIRHEYQHRVVCQL